MINVTKTYLPPLDEYAGYLRKLWDSGWITNQGVLATQLEKELAAYLGVRHIHFLSNGTLTLQVALKALELKGEIITTPFSYVATTSSILWEHCTPVFVDIENKTFCIDASKIEASITSRTTAILATHVYGYPCDVEAIDAIAKKHNLKVIYDAAHAFGVKIKGTSILNYGDISSLSFHATKLFHTVEGGALVCNDAELAQKIYLYKTFGHRGDDYFTIGINGKNSEFHAAMGLCNLPRVDQIIKDRKAIAELYSAELAGLSLQYPAPPANISYNYSYFPVFFESEEKMLRVKKALEQNDIFPRRYFYPSLNNLPYLKGTPCPVSEDYAARVLSLPFYHELAMEDVKKISAIIRKTLTL